jgi:hypothetical protein
LCSNEYGKKRTGKTPLWRPKREWKVNIKFGLKWRGYDEVFWIEVAKIRVQQWGVVHTIIIFRES